VFRDIQLKRTVNNPERIELKKYAHIATNQLYTKKLNKLWYQKTKTSPISINQKLIIDIDLLTLFVTEQGKFFLRATGNCSTTTKISKSDQKQEY
jgi:ribosomal protein S18